MLQFIEYRKIEFVFRNRFYTCYEAGEFFRRKQRFVEFEFVGNGVAAFSSRNRINGNAAFAERVDIARNAALAYFIFFGKIAACDFFLYQQLQLLL